MKTRNKIIIIGIILTIILFGTQQFLMYQCGTLPIYMETPRNPNLWHCLQIWENQSEQHPNSDLQEIIIDENKGGNDYGITTNMAFSYTEYPNTENLDSVLRSCEQWEKARVTNFTSPDGTKYAIAGVGFEWFNSTHYTDNGICDFIPMKKHMEDQIIGAISEYCGSTNKIGFDNPYEYWFANETHYLDSDTCLWQILDTDMALVLPDNWKTAYVDD